MLEKEVINDFGKEWNTYNQTDLNKIEQKIIFDKFDKDWIISNANLKDRNGETPRVEVSPHSHHNRRHRQQSRPHYV